MSTALGFAVLEIPDDVRLDDGVAELSADLTSPDGKPLEDVVCVVDLKVTSEHDDIMRSRAYVCTHDNLFCSSHLLDRLIIVSVLATRQCAAIVSNQKTKEQKIGYISLRKHLFIYSVLCFTFMFNVNHCGICLVRQQATGPPPLSARETSSSEEDEVGAPFLLYVLCAITAPASYLNNYE